jgi:trehalose 6-phosphate synthase/phosphatase
VEELVKTILSNHPNNNFGLIYGNMVIEVKYKEVSKGSFVAGKVKENNYDFILAIGDDATDEDMFSVLQNMPNCYTIKVGITPTKARCNLINVSSVISFLDQLSKYKRVTHSLRLD